MKGAFRCQGGEQIAVWWDLLVPCEEMWHGCAVDAQVWEHVRM